CCSRDEGRQHGMKVSSRSFQPCSLYGKWLLICTIAANHLAAFQILDIHLHENAVAGGVSKDFQSELFAIKASCIFGSLPLGEVKLLLDFRAQVYHGTVEIGLDWIYLVCSPAGDTDGLKPGLGVFRFKGDRLEDMRRPAG